MQEPENISKENPGGRHAKTLRKEGTPKKSPSKPNPTSNPTSNKSGKGRPPTGSRDAARRQGDPEVTGTSKGEIPVSNPANKDSSSSQPELGKQQAGEQGTTSALSSKDAPQPQTAPLTLPTPREESAPQLLAIDEIIQEERFRGRVGKDGSAPDADFAATEYKCRQASDFPPVIVARSKNPALNKRLLSGFTRIKAANLRGDTQINAVFVDVASFEDAFKVCVEANLRNGTQIKPADRRAQMAHMEAEGLARVKIAEFYGVTPPTLSKLLGKKDKRSKAERNAILTDDKLSGKEKAARLGLTESAVSQAITKLKKVSKSASPDSGQTTGALNASGVTGESKAAEESQSGNTSTELSSCTVETIKPDGESEDSVKQNHESGPETDPPATLTKGRILDILTEVPRWEDLLRPMTEGVQGAFKAFLKSAQRLENALDGDGVSTETKGDENEEAERSNKHENQ